MSGHDLYLFPQDVLELMLVKSGNPNILLLSKEITQMLKFGFESANKDMKWAFLHCKHGFNNLFYTLWFHYHGSKVIDEYKKDYIQKKLLVKLPDDLKDDYEILDHVQTFLDGIIKCDTYMSIEDPSMSIILLYAMKFKVYGAVKNILEKAVRSGRRLMLNCTDHDLQIALAEAMNAKTNYTTCDFFYSKHYPLQIVAMDDNYTMQDLQNMVQAGADVDIVFKATIIDWSFNMSYYDCKRCLDTFVMLGANLYKIDMIHDLYTYIRDDTCDEITAIKQFEYLIAKGANPDILLNLLIECKPYCEGPLFEHRCEMSMLLARGTDINANNGQWLMTYIVDPWEKMVAFESGVNTTLENLISYYNLNVNVLDDMALRIAVSSFLQLGSIISKEKPYVRDWVEETDRSRILLRAIDALLPKCKTDVIKRVYNDITSFKCCHQAEMVNKQMLMHVFKNAIYYKDGQDQNIGD